MCFRKSFSLLVFPKTWNLESRLEEYCLNFRKETIKQFNGIYAPSVCRSTQLEIQLFYFFAFEDVRHQHSSSVSVRPQLECVYGTTLFCHLYQFRYNNISFVILMVLWWWPSVWETNLNTIRRLLVQRCPFSTRVPLEHWIE